MDTVIRIATENDLPAILDIYNDAILNTTAVYDYTPHTLVMRREWFAAKQKNGFPVLVAEHGGMVAGFASYGPFRAWAAYKYTVEHSVYVHPEFRRRGIAKQLMARLIEYAKQENVHTIVAGIDADNSVSIHLHRQLGFEQVAHFREVGYKFGRWLDLVFMQMILDPPASLPEG